MPLPLRLTTREFPTLLRPPDQSDRDHLVSRSQPPPDQSFCLLITAVVAFGPFSSTDQLPMVRPTIHIVSLSEADIVRLAPTLVVATIVVEDNSAPGCDFAIFCPFFDQPIAGHYWLLLSAPSLSSPLSITTGGSLCAVVSVFR